MLKIINLIVEKIQKRNAIIFFKKRNLYKFNGIPTHLTEVEKKKLYELAILKSDGCIVEIGSYIGASSVFIASGLNAGRIICIDTWENDAMSEGKRNTWDDFCLNTSVLVKKILPIKGYSNEVISQVKEVTRGSIDMLFIDGDHSHKGCKSDFDLYFPLVKKDGIVVFHDSGWAEGVKKVIKEDAIGHTYNHNKLPNMFYAWKK